MRRDGFLDGGELASKLVRCREPLEEDGEGEDMLVLAIYGCGPALGGLCAAHLADEVLGGVEVQVLALER